MYWPAYAGRDAARTPMPWRDAPGGGFTDPGVRPWLPIGDTSVCNVEQQRSDEGSILTLCRDLIALRRSSPELQTGGYQSVAAPEGVWAFKRADRFVVALNLSDRAAALDDIWGTIRVCTDRQREGETPAGQLELGEWEGLIVEFAARGDHIGSG
jgi:alpha-glucosidase